jgi:hypothetical protein
MANWITEGDVEGVMDRPVGNTADVYMECEKWYVFASSGNRTAAYIDVV